MTLPAGTLTSGALLDVYRPAGPTFTAGQGSWLVAANGERYLDFTSGIGVCALGHGHPILTDGVTASLGAGLIHTSNLFRTEPADRLARWLVEHSSADRVFLCNSGAEANEAAIKFARRWAGSDRPEVIAFRGGFHGRTTGALALTDRPAIRDPFLPLLPGVHFCDVGDDDSVERVLSSGRVCAVIIEPVQGEGGVRPIAAGFLRTLRARCDEHEALLIVDEVQTGLGRTGTLWAYEDEGIEPDLITLAKPLAGGLPVGAVLLADHVAATIRPGDHATTFGGGPLVAAAALAVCRIIGAPEFLSEVRSLGHLIGEKLAALAAHHPSVLEARGRGLMWGLELAGEAEPVVARCLEQRLLVCGAGPSVVRLLPPLNVDRGEIATAIEILEGSL